MDPIPKMVIPTQLARRRGEVEVSTAEEIDELISQLIIAKAGITGAQSAIGAKRAMDAARDVEAGRQEPEPECWCGHLERVHNAVSSGDGRGFCTECTPGRCGRYEAARHTGQEPEPRFVTAPRERGCDAVNEGGWHCYRSGPHRIHRDSNGDEWETAPGQAPAGRRPLEVVRTAPRPSCQQRHPDKDTACIGPEHHPEPCRDTDGDEWVPARTAVTA